MNKYQALLSSLGRANKAVHLDDLARELGTSVANVQEMLQPLEKEDVAYCAGSFAALRPLSERAAPPAGSRERRVVLEMNEQTAAAVQQALEFYARIGLGQFKELLELAREGLLKNRDGSSISLEQLEAAEKGIEQVKQTLLGFHPDASFGIGSEHVHPQFQQAWSVSKAVRHRLAWDRTPEGRGSVFHDEPLEADRLPGLAVRTQAAQATPADTADLPADMVLQFKDGNYRVIGAAPDGNGYLLVAESHSPQTAIQMARNVAAGARARALSL